MKCVDTVTCVWMIVCYLIYWLEFLYNLFILLWSFVLLFLECLKHFLRDRVFVPFQFLTMCVIYNILSFCLEVSLLMRIFNLVCTLCKVISSYPLCVVIVIFLRVFCDLNIPSGKMKWQLIMSMNLFHVWLSYLCYEMLICLNHSMSPPNSDCNNACHCIILSPDGLCLTLTEMTRINYFYLYTKLLPGDGKIALHIIC